MAITTLSIKWLQKKPNKDCISLKKNPPMEELPEAPPMHCLNSIQASSSSSFSDNKLESEDASFKLQTITFTPEPGVNVYVTEKCRQ